MLVSKNQVLQNIIFRKIRKIEKKVIRNVGLTGNIAYDFYKLYTQNESSNLELLKGYYYSYNASQQKTSILKKILANKKLREKVELFGFELRIVVDYIKKRL